MVVSNSSPLIILSGGGHLGLLRELYATVVIPTEVYAEVVTGGGSRAGAVEVAAADWIEVRQVRSQELVRELETGSTGFALDRERRRR